MVTEEKDSVYEEGIEGLIEAERPFFEIASRFGDLYISYRKRYVLMSNGRTYVPKYMDKPLALTNKTVCGHLNHKYAICVFAGSASSKFICFDVDDGDRETVGKIIDILADVGFPREHIYVSTSGGKGFHVEIFFDCLVYTARLKKLYDYVCVTGKLDPVKVEFRPTASQSIKLPLSVHRKTGNVCWYLDRDTLEPIRTQSYVCQIVQVNSDDACEIIKKLPKVNLAVVKKTVKAVSEKEVIASDQALVESGIYPDLTVSGERHKLMVQIAVHNRYRGLSPAACTSELKTWYKKQDMKLIKESETSVLTDIKEIVEWAYSERFKAKKLDQTIRFTKEDYKILAAQTIQSRRKFMFLLLASTKRFGKLCYGMDKISSMTGISRTALLNTVSKLEDGHWITHKAGKAAQRDDGTCFRLPNSYWLDDGVVGWAKGFFSPHLPGLDNERAAIVSSIRFSDEEIELGEDFTFSKDNVEKSYIRVVGHMADMDDLEKIMTAKEFNDFKRLKERYENE